jgi:hypothetical protein
MPTAEEFEAFMNVVVKLEAAKEAQFARMFEQFEEDRSCKGSSVRKNV